MGSELDETAAIAGINTHYNDNSNNNYNTDPPITPPPPSRLSSRTGISLRIDTASSAGQGIIGGSIAQAERERQRRREASERKRRLVEVEQERVRVGHPSERGADGVVNDDDDAMALNRGLGLTGMGYASARVGETSAAAQLDGVDASGYASTNSHSTPQQYTTDMQYDEGNESMDEDSHGIALADDGSVDNGTQQHQQHYEYQQQHAQQQQYHNEHGQTQSQGLDHADDQQEMEDEEDDDEMSSSPSIPDENISFDLVYALHTFLATVEGQASVVKGDELTLLDDSNSYWWLVRVLKTQAVGYIPAENIETPFERLARLNKHRNVDITFATQEDMLTGTGSSLAQTRFTNPHHPTNKAVQAGPKRTVLPINPTLAGGGRFVEFAPPTYHEHEGFYFSGSEDDEEYDEEGEEGDSMDEDEDEEEDEEAVEAQVAAGLAGPQQSQHAGNMLQTPVESDAHIEPDETAALTQQSLDGPSPHDRDQAPAQATAPLSSLSSPSQQQAAIFQGSTARVAQAQAQAALGVGRPAHLQSPLILQEGFAAAPTTAGYSPPEQYQPQLNRKLSLDDQLRAEQEASMVDRERNINQQHQQTANKQRQVSPQKQQQPQGPIRRPSQTDAQGQSLNILQPRSSSAASQNSLSQVMSSPSSSQSSKLRPFPSEDTEIVADGPAGNAAREPRKISLTPRIARDGSVESGLSDRALSPTPSNGSGSQQAHGGFPQYGNAMAGERQYQQGQMARNASNASSVPSGADQSVNSGLTNSTSTSEYAYQQRAQQYQTGAQGQLLPRRGSSGSASSGITGKGPTGEKRATSPHGSDSDTSKTSPKDASSKDGRKKKSSGILGGLFSRNKKEKEKSKDGKDTSSKKSDKRGGNAASDDDRHDKTPSPHGSDSSSTSGRGPVSAISGPPGGIVSQQLQARRAREEMFGTDAALRQQEVEAQNAMYQQYGIHPRSPGDVVNTQTFNMARAGSGGASSLSPPQMHATPPQHFARQMQNVSSPHNLGSLGLSPNASSMGSSLSSTGFGINAPLGPNGRPMRPGSLIGSPHVTTAGGQGGEVPLLNVLRVFAGENIESDATFKTVLLNDATSTADLVKQAMQRFHLDPPAASVSAADVVMANAAIMAEYYLTAKEVSGDETTLQPGQRPMQVLERLAHASGTAESKYGFPSVKRSSVGSINSIASNLSTHPAIEKLRMSDFSDDSVVKLFIHKRTPPSTSSANMKQSASMSSIAASLDSVSTRDEDLSVNLSRLSATGSIIDKGPAPGMPVSPMLRFAVRVIIHAEDVPESMAFDPLSPTIVSRATLSDRQARPAGRSPLLSQASSAVNPRYREKLMFFPRNANVSEVLETALDRFGIVEGVVDGGDEVDDIGSKRRSTGRVRYGLSMLLPSSEDDEKLLTPSGKILDAYATAPTFRHYERNSKEFRRRSMDAPYNTPTTADIQPSDPTFIIRKASQRLSTDTLRAVSDTRSSAQPPAGPPVLSTSLSSRSVYATPMSELPPGMTSPSPQYTPTHTRMPISARANSQQGIDVTLADQATVRSVRDGASNTTRYSYIGPDGSERDISEIVREEWQNDKGHTANLAPARDVSSSLSHVTADSFASALESPSTPVIPISRTIADHRLTDDHPDAEERVAINNIASVPLNIDRSRDFLQDVLDRNGAISPASSNSPRIVHNELVHERLDRVLAKARSSPGGVTGGIASALRNHAQPQRQFSGSETSLQGSPPRTRSNISSVTDSNTGSGRSTPTGQPARPAAITRTRSGSTNSAGRASPLLQSMRSTPQPEAPPSSASSTPRRGPQRGHVKQASLASVASDTSSSPAMSSPATISGNTDTTPVSSARAGSSLGSSQGRLPIPYREDHGLDFLMAIADIAGSEPLPARQPRLTAMDYISDYEYPKMSEEIASIFEKPKQRIDALEARLDRLLDQVMKA